MAATLDWLSIVWIWLATLTGHIVAFVFRRRAAVLRPLWLIMLAALSVRLVPAILWQRGDTFDIGVYTLWAEMLWQGQDIYAIPDLLTRHNWLPFQLYLIAAADALASRFQLSFVTLVKLVPILADTGIAALVYRGALALTADERNALRLALIYAFNPVSVLVVSYHGQIDSIPLFFALAAWYVLQFTHSRFGAIFSGALLGLAILDKTWPVIFLPILALQVRGWRGRIAWAAAAIGVPALGVAVYSALFAVIASQVVGNVGAYQSFAGNWGWTQILLLVTGSLQRVGDFALIGKAFFVFAFVLFYVFVAPRQSALAAMTTVVLLFFAITPGLNFYYVMWLLPFALLTCALTWYHRFVSLSFLWLALFYFGTYLPNWMSELIPPNAFIALAILLWLITVAWLAMHLKQITWPRIDPYLALLILFSVFAIGPLLGPGYFWGAHDGRHSVYFLFEFDRVIQDGILYPRWLPDFTFGYGYPFFNIYGPAAFYIGEAFHLFGFDFVSSTKIVFALAILLSGPAMFGFVKRLTGSSQAAFLSGLAYVYIPYHIADIYVRAALAESFALIFLPLTLWGFYEVTLRPTRLTLVAAAAAYGAMWFTHNAIAILFTPVLAIWVLFLMLGEIRKRPIPNPYSLIPTGRFTVSNLFSLGLPPLAALFFGLGLSAIFVIPMALEYSAVRVDQWTANYYDYSNHFVSLFQLFNPTWGFGISVPGTRDGMSFQLGAVPVLLAILSIGVVVTNPNGFRRYWFFFAGMTVVVALLMFALSLPLWEALRLVMFAQFPWRLLTLTTVSLAVLAGAIVYSEKSQGLALPTILLGVLIVLGSYPFLTAQTQLEAKEGPVGLVGLMKFQQSAGEMTGSTAWVKEIPTWSNMADVYLAGKRVKTKIDLTAEPQPEWVGVDQSGKGLRADGERIFIVSQANDVPITFNTFYYPGWRAYITPEFGNEIIRELPITPVGELGRMQVRMPEGRYWLILRFEDTPPRIVGQWLSAVSIVLALGLLVWEFRSQRKAHA